MRKRMLAAALACALLAGCGPVRTEPLEQEVARVDAPVIAYVPLDDRPDNAERVVYLAESLGYELAMPERDLYRTRLDGQPLNENGTQYGDRGALYEWVAAQEAAGCDRYILSVDQLLSGGLVSSRAMTGENPVTLSTGETLTETELLAAVIDLLAADADNRVWLLDTVMRLAATTGYGGFGLNEYNALRSYGMAPRPHLEGADLTIENIVADYSLGADGTPVPVEAEEPLPEGAVADCAPRWARGSWSIWPPGSGSCGSATRCSAAWRERRRASSGCWWASTTPRRRTASRKTRSPISGRSCGRGTPCSPAWTTWPSRRWPGCIWTSAAGRGPRSA